MGNPYYFLSKIFNDIHLDTTSLFAYDYINDLIDHRLNKYIHIFIQKEIDYERFLHMKDEDINRLKDKKRENQGIIGNIKENELAEFCSKLSISNIIPNHYDMFMNNTGSIDLFKKEMIKRDPNQSIITLNCGDKIEI